MYMLWNIKKILRWISHIIQNPFHNMYIILGNKNFFEKNVGKKLIIFRKGGMEGGTPSRKIPRK